MNKSETLFKLCYPHLLLASPIYIYTWSIIYTYLYFIEVLNIQLKLSLITMRMKLLVLSASVLQCVSQAERSDGWRAEEKER